MKRLLVELENLPEAGKKYSGELDSEIFGIDDEEVTSIGPLAFDLHVQRFDVSDSLREEIVLDFPAYPKCADGGMENDCMAKTPYFGVDKEGGTGVNSSAPIRNSGVWDALNELGDHY